MNLMRRMRIWAGRIGLGRKIAIALGDPGARFGDRDLSRADRSAALSGRTPAPSCRC